MTTAAPSPARTISSYARDFDDLKTSHSGEAPAWLSSLRQQAWSEFERLGFPTTRRGNELWKYTDLRRLNKEAFARVSEDSVGDITSTTSGLTSMQ